MAKGKRVGTRRAQRKRALPSRASLILCLGITVCVVAWGYLVKAAIDFGTAARDGETNAWLFLALACLGAAACLFAGLLLGARVLRKAGLLLAPTPAEDGPAPADEHAPSTAGVDAVDLIETPTYAPPPGPYRGKRVAR
ncbi:hypothetical protein [Nocardioides alcanivorans]|uniref:hypothetical protein n=1 Tax=Nocardioides alcanivorans TaxID=2897352 RepID=UPI001F3F4FE4|nr:hypothetical protein [Nocardioides alcanivorans]